jgi:hypothetical protein
MRIIQNSSEERLFFDTEPLASCMPSQKAKILGRVIPGVGKITNWLASEKTQGRRSLESGRRTDLSSLFRQTMSIPRSMMFNDKTD